MVQEGRQSGRQTGGDRYRVVHEMREKGYSLRLAFAKKNIYQGEESPSGR